MATVPRVLFLPGTSGDGDFWRPVAEELPAEWEERYFSWPGLGRQPHDASVRGIDDLVLKVADALERPSDLVAQSMGGIIAVRLATQYPEKVRRLVLAATPGGIDVSALGGADWREEYREEFPGAARWITDERSDLDLTEQLTRIEAPTLLLWGDDDPISPVSIGEHLLALLPRATLRVIAGGTHSFARDEHRGVAPLVAAHLG